MASAVTGAVGLVRVLEFDPELAGFLAREELPAAREQLIAPVLTLGPGRLWGRPLMPSAQENGFGLLVLRGLLIERLQIGERQTVELLFPGDLLRPWPGREQFGDLLTKTNWRVSKPAVLAVLDCDFARRAVRWPSIGTALADRALRRSRGLALRLAVNQIPQLPARLHLTLWYLADRVGIVDRNGVLVPLDLSQRTLGELVSAQRQSVSRSLKELAEDGLVEATDEGYRLCGEPPAGLFRAAGAQSPRAPADASTDGPREQTTPKVSPW